MLHWIVIAAASMAVISTAYHLGFVEKAYAICGKIAECAMCSTMWGTLVVLLILGSGFFEAVALSFLAAYLSNWFGLLLAWFAEKYDKIWQRNNSNKSQPPKR